MLDMIKKRADNSHMPKKWESGHSQAIQSLVKNNKKYQLPYYKSLNENRIIYDKSDKTLNKPKSTLEKYNINEDLKEKGVTQINVIQLSVNSDSMSFLNNKKRA